MKEATVPAGESQVVVRRQFSSMPMEYRFTARSAEAGREPAGTVEIKRSKIFSSPPPETVPLQAENVVTAGFWDNHVTVTVHAEEDVVVASDRLPGRSFLPILLVALVVVIIAGAVIAFAFL